MDGRIDKRTSRSTNEGAEIGKERPITLEPRERERERERDRLPSQTSKKKKTKIEGREEIDRAAPDCLAPGSLAPHFTSYRRNTSEHQKKTLKIQSQIAQITSGLMKQSLTGSRIISQKTYCRILSVSIPPPSPDEKTILFFHASTLLNLAASLT